MAIATTMMLLVTMMMMTASQCAANLVSSPLLFVSRRHSSMGPPWEVRRVWLIGSDGDLGCWEVPSAGKRCCIGDGEGGEGRVEDG